MNNPAIQQTLVELEESLAQINSARSQVNSVTVQSEQLIEAFNSILSSLKSLSDDFGVDKGKFKNNLDKSFQVLNEDLKVSTSRVSKDIQSFLQTLNDATEKMQKDVSDFHHHTIAIEKKLEEAEVRINEINFKSDFKRISDSIKEMTESLEKNQNHNEEMLKHQITELENKLNKKNLIMLLILSLGILTSTILTIVL